MKIVGINIKRFREAKNLSLRVLAKKLDISASFISQIETGKVSPSLSTLKKIAECLGTTVGTILGEDNAQGNNLVMRADEKKKVFKLADGMTLQYLTNQEPFKQMVPLLFELEKGAFSGDQSYQHYGQEFVYVLEGKIEITVKERKHVLAMGDSIYFDSSHPHSFKNLHTSKSRALWVDTPPSF